MYCGKSADWIWIPFGVVSGVGRGMGALHGGHVRKRKGGGGFGFFAPIGLNGVLCMWHCSVDVAYPWLSD